MIDLQKNLIISGPPRSGTTMFSAYVDGHSKINWFPDEAFIFEHFWNIGEKNIHTFIEAAKISKLDLINGIKDRFIMPPVHEPLSDFPDLKFDWSEEIFLNKLDLENIHDCEDLWNNLKDSYLSALGMRKKEVVCTKAADFGRSVMGGLKYINNSYGVIVVRNPIDTINSLKRYRQKGGYKVLSWPTLSSTIIDMNNLVHFIKSLEKQKNNNFIVVRYEDMLATPYDSMMKLSEMLNLNFEEAFKNPTMLGKEWKSNSSFIDSAGQQLPPSKRPMILSEGEIKYINIHTKLFKEYFNY